MFSIALGMINKHDQCKRHCLPPEFCQPGGVSLVRVVRIELTLPKEQVFETCASTNSATPALLSSSPKRRELNPARPCPHPATGDNRPPTVVSGKVQYKESRNRMKPA